MGYEKGDSFPLEDGAPAPTPRLEGKGATQGWRDWMIFVGLFQTAMAIDRDSGEIIWEWKSPKNHSDLTLLLDGDRLIVNGGGYIYCLDPRNGRELWSNLLKGKGVGAMSIITPRSRVLPSSRPTNR